jgi:co-chaperonin GroES (HSP10)
MITPIRNVFIVSIDKEAESKIVLGNGTELYLDKEFGEQSTTQQHNDEWNQYFRDLDREYSKLHDEWIKASKHNLPTVVNLKRRLMQIEREQAAGKVNKIIKPYSNVVQHGIVQQIPRKVDARVKKFDNGGRPYYDGYYSDVEINIGDTIYFHHFVGDTENEVDVDGKTFYKADMSHIFGVSKKGNFIPTEKWIFASPVMETDEDIQHKVGDIVLYTKIATEKKHLLSRVEYCSKQASLAGYKEGDIILHPTFSEYNMKINGKELYRMHLDDIFCVVSGL